MHPQMLARTFAVSAAIAIMGIGRTPESLDMIGKLRFHGQSTYSPPALAGAAACAGFLKKNDLPTEWGQGAAAYGKRFGSTLSGSAIHSALVFGLDSTLKQDPRYSRSGGTRWYPDRFKTVHRGIMQGSATIGLGLVGNLGSQYWPDIQSDIKRKPRSK